MNQPNHLKLTLFLILFTLNSVYAQQRMGGMQGNAKIPAIGRLYGKIIDSQTKTDIGYATVRLFNMRDSLIGGALTKENGDFLIEKLPMGRFKLDIRFDGFKTLIVPVSISMNNLDNDIGNIKLELNTAALKEVVISDQKPSVIIGVDRRIYNVEKDLTSKGGTAVDVMKNIPGLTVDADGNVSLRNNSPTIFIDGRPTNLTMEQVPSDQIERIEVITNPSVKFDASAAGGIVNVVMKKNNKPGYNGVIGANAGTNQFDGLNRYSLNGNINIKEGRINFFTSYNFNHNNNPTKGYTNRTTINNGMETGSYNQNNKNNATRQMQNARIGFDYTVSNRNTLTVSQSIMYGGYSTDDKQYFTQSGALGQLIYNGNRITTQETNMQNLSSQLMWKHTYPKQGKEWTSDINFNMGSNKSNSYFNTNSFDSLGNGYTTNPQLQRNLGSGNSKMVTFQFDYTNPITDTARFEFGVKSNYRINSTGLNVGMKQPSGDYTTDTFLTTDYKIHDITNAMYVNYTNMFLGIGYMAGVRFEQTMYTGELVNKHETFEFLYPNGTKNLAKAFFPSLYLSKKINTKHEFQVNFSRKINRPGWMQIIPFIMFSDKNNYQIGNPSLAPEFANLMEANYNYVFGFGNWLTSAYLRYQQSPITPYVYRSTTDSNVLISTYVNGDHNISSGWENTVKFNFLKKKADFSLNANIYYSKITASPNSTQLVNSGMSWNTKAMFSYRLPKQYTTQINGSYEAPRIIAQGKTKEVYSIDYSLSKDIGKKLTFTFTINDIFNTRGFGSYYNTTTFTQDMWRRRETRFFRLGFTYRFGEWDVSLFKKKSNKKSDGSMDQIDF